MRKTLALAVLLSLVACGEKKEAASTTAPKEAATAPKVDDKAAAPAVAPAPAAEVKLAALELTAVGEDWKGLSLQAPEGAKAEESFGSAKVTAGDTFQMEIGSSKTDIAARKKEIEANDVNKVKSFLVDSPDALLYESEVMGQNEFHFVANVKAGDKELYCEDTKGPRFSKADAETMLKACQSIAKK